MREERRQPNRVVVTGAGGFIGSHVVGDQLARGRSVVAIDLNLAGLDVSGHADRLTAIEADIRDESRIRKAVEGADTVFHLASAHLEVGKPESFFYQVNVDAVGMLVAAADDAGVERFVHCSSVGVFGPLGDSLPADEDTACHPDILYEKTKLAGERSALETAASRSMQLIAVRPAWVYGPGCPRTLKLLRTIAGGKFFFVGDGSNLRHPLYIDDMLKGFEMAAVVPGVDGQVVIIAGQSAVTLRELVQTIARTLGARDKFPAIPLGMMKPAAWLVESVFTTVGKEPPFSTRSLKFFTENSSFSIEKARSLLAFEPTVSLQAGMEATVATLRADGRLE